MRILHIWDQAGVASVLAKYQQLQGHQSKVIRIGGENHDRYGIYNFYNQYVVTFDLEQFVQKSIEEAELADIIHVHSKSSVFLKVRNKFSKTSKKKFILHYHGSDIRGIDKHLQSSLMTRHPQSLGLASMLYKPERIAKRVLGMPTTIKQLNSKAQTLADEVIVSTPDLLELVPGATYLPNPVDTDHFKPDLTQTSKSKEALTMETEVSSASQTLSYCKKNGINLDIEVYDRTKAPIPYSEMPQFLKGYGVYVDIKFVNNTILQALSMTGLQALACGLTILDYQLTFRHRLPAEHDPANTVSQLSDIYSR